VSVVSKAYHCRAAASHMAVVCELTTRGTIMCEIPSEEYSVVRPPQEFLTECELNVGE
jgi:hypothetical protein